MKLGLCPPEADALTADYATAFCGQVGKAERRRVRKPEVSKPLCKCVSKTARAGVGL